MDEKARLALNLNVLRRHDGGGVEEIIDSASFVVAYRYNSGAWTKTNIEGTLFLYRRTTSPHYHFFILNRPTPVNFSAPLVSENDLEVTEEYIIYRKRLEDSPNPEDEIWGIWVYDDGKGQRQRIGEAMHRLSGLGGHVEKPTSESLLLDSFLAQAAINSKSSKPTSDPTMDGIGNPPPIIHDTPTPSALGQPLDLLAMLRKESTTPDAAPHHKPSPDAHVKTPDLSILGNEGKSFAKPSVDAKSLAKPDRNLAFLASTIPRQVMMKKSKRPGGDGVASASVSTSLPPTHDQFQTLANALLQDTPLQESRSPSLPTKMLQGTQELRIEDPQEELVRALVTALKARASETSTEYNTLSELLRGVNSFLRDPKFVDRLWAAWQVQ